LLSGVVRGHGAFLTRASADLDEAARRLAKGLAAEEPDARSMPGADDLVSAMASAAGLPVLLDTVAAQYRREAYGSVTWPLVRWWRALGTDPLTRLNLDGQAESQLRELTRASLAMPSPAQRERVDLAVRQVATAVAEKLPPRWGQAIRTSVSPQPDELAGALDEAVGHVDLTVRRPLWWRLVGLIQYVLVACTLVGFAWLAVLGVLRWTGQSPPEPPYLGPLPMPTVLFVGGLVLGALVGWAAAALVRQGARRRRTEAVEELRTAVGEVAWSRVVAPMARVLAQHRAAREALSGAF
jgi:hypothetical protein